MEMKNYLFIYQNAFQHIVVSFQIQHLSAKQLFHFSKSTLATKIKFYGILTIYLGNFLGKFFGL
jgi:hypothetical protein